MKHRPKTTSDDALALEESLRKSEQAGQDYVLELYITGMTARSAEALAGIKEICEKYLRGHYDLEVIDLYQHPAMAKAAQIIVAPTLIKRSPSPARRLVGNLSEVKRVLSGLGLHHIW
jgi:circadian clock protein KaiB